MTFNPADPATPVRARSRRGGGVLQRYGLARQVRHTTALACLVMVTALSLEAGAASTVPTVFRIAPPSGAGSFGAAVAGLGDVDGDGAADVAVGAPASRHAYVVSGATGTVLHDMVYRAEARYAFGVAVAKVGDADGDGQPDIAVGAPTDPLACSPPEPCETARLVRGKAFVFSSASGALVRELVPATGNHPGFGRSVVGTGDLSGDGVPDIVVGAPDGPGSGGAFAFSGADGSQLWSRLGPSVGPGPVASFGRLVVATADVSGDGIGDALVSGPSDSRGGAPAGSVSVLSGATGEVVRVVSDPAPDPGDLFGKVMSAMGDQDGDGVVDHLIGEGGSDQLHLYSGRDGMLMRSLAVPADAPVGGFSLAPVDDKDGDRRDDVWVGVPSARSVYLLNGKGEVLASATTALAEAAFGRVVTPVGSAGDDRRVDLAVGDPTEPGGGAVYLVGAGQETPAVAGGQDNRFEECSSVACRALESQASAPAQSTTTTVAAPTTTTLPEAGAPASSTQTTSATFAPATASLPKPAGATAPRVAHPETGGAEGSATGLAGMVLGMAGITVSRRLRVPAPSRA